MNIFTKRTVESVPQTPEVQDYTPSPYDTQCETCGRYLTAQYTPRAVDTGGSFGTVKHSYCEEACVPPALRRHLATKKSEFDARATVRLREAMEQAKQTRIEGLRDRLNYLLNNRITIEAGGFDVETAINETQANLDREQYVGPGDANVVIPPPPSVAEQRKAFLASGVDRGAWRVNTEP